MTDGQMIESYRRGRRRIIIAAGEHILVGGRKSRATPEARVVVSQITQSHVGAPGAGAAIGGALGAGTGALVGDQMQKRDVQQADQQQQIDQQNRELQRQRQELERLKQQQRDEY